MSLPGHRLKTQCTWSTHTWTQRDLGVIKCHHWQHSCIGWIYQHRLLVQHCSLSPEQSTTPAWQRLCRAETIFSSLLLKLVDAHTMHDKCKREMRQRLRAVPFHTCLAGERTAVTKWKAGRITASHHDMQHRPDDGCDVPLPFELKGCRHQAPRKEL